MPARLLAAGRLALTLLVVALGALPCPAQGYATTAALEVRLPADAELWFEGVLTTQTGERRLFATPPLHSGVTYSYDVVARWREDGRVVVQGQRLLVHAGESLQVDFVPPPRRNRGITHMSLREIPKTWNRPASGPAIREPLPGHGSLVELTGGTLPLRPLPGFMSVNDLAAPAADGAARPTRAIPVAPGRMSITEFDEPRR
jgi:uncharacterized protein (TIGR03000 family)